ncbi:Tetraspanin family-domain-containing protein [Spinellus fusiger]|nr:Tetraspanin family-domain-containing protein [Spinellus fusiger]
MEPRLMNSRSRGLREPTTYFHTLLMFLGLSVITLGAYTINTSVSPTSSFALLLIGGIITLVSFIGCFGAHLEHTGFLRSYNSTAAILLILQIVCVALLYVRRTQADTYANAIWDFFTENDSQFLVDFETIFHCCGYGSVDDRAAPATCVQHLGFHSDCKSTLITLVSQWHEWIIAGALLLLALQFIALIGAVVLTAFIERDIREEEMYLSLISKQPSSSHIRFSGSVIGNSSHSEGSSSSGTYFGRHPHTPYWQKPDFHSPPPQQRISRYGSTSSAPK